MDHQLAAPAAVESSFWSITNDKATFKPLSNSPEPEKLTGYP